MKFEDYYIMFVLICAVGKFVGDFKKLIEIRKK